MKRILLATAIAVSSIVLVNTDAMAQVNLNIVIGNPPPPVRYEVVPAPRQGYIWAPGYWNWNGSRHVWNGGRWVRARNGYYYVQPEWRESGNQWRLDHGGWKRGEGHGGNHGDDRRDERHDDKHNKHGNKHGDHCPPGQAKKGNC